jgi:hypothetical protein
MYQEVGETSKAIVETDEKTIEGILSSNKDKKEPYWIVIFVKPLKVKVDHKPALVKVIKAYYKKPQNQVGMIVGEVNNANGTIKWEVNMPDRPFGYQVLGLEQDGCQVYQTSIPNSYVYG